MEINQSIFKTYDIRGIYPTDLNEDAARGVARALVTLTKGKRFAVGRDVRVSSPALWQALTDELIALGCDVTDLGLIPTEAIYFTAGTYDFDVTMTVTASHNPAEYNGFKMMRGKSDVIRGVDVGKFIGTPVESSSTPGQRTTQDVLTPYLEHILTKVDQAALKPLKIVIDAGNGTAGHVLPKLLAGLPMQVVPLYYELDGSFPNRPSNPLADGALNALQKKVVEEQAVCGVAFDGDCDRVFFVDENGKFIQADLTLILIAKEVLRQQPGKAIIYNALCTRAVKEWVAEMGGTSWRSAVGYANVKKAMIEHDAILGGEISAHYAFLENFNADSGFLAMLKVLELLSRSDQPLSQLINQFAKYARLNELRLKVDDRAAMVQKIRDHYRTNEQDELDGVTVWGEDWWINVRPSNTEPLIGLTVEAPTEEQALAKQREAMAVLGLTA